MNQMMNANEQQQIFDEWLDQHKGLFFKVIRAYAFNLHDQQDLFQEIATQVWNSVPKYRGESAITTWIYRVALYTAMSWSKKERQHRDHHQTITLNEHPLLLSSEIENPRLDWLYDQIAELNEVDRSLTLLMLDGFSYKETAETLGITENHAGVKWNRIKRHFAEKSIEEFTNGI